MVTAVSGALIVVAVSAPGASADADILDVDLSNVTGFAGGFGSNSAGSTGEAAGQSFHPTQETITRAAVNVTISASPDAEPFSDMFLRIEADSSCGTGVGTPSGSVLGTAIIPASEFADHVTAFGYGSSAWFEASFAGGVPVVPGNRYHLTIFNHDPSLYGFSDSAGYSRYSTMVASGPQDRGGSADRYESWEGGWTCGKYGFDTAVKIWGAPSDAVGPLVSDTQGSPNPVAIDTAVALTATVDDSTTGGSDIASAVYSIDGGSSVAMTATDSVFDEPIEDVEAGIPAFTTAGTHRVCVTATDAAGNTSASDCILLAVYDPSAGFVTGGGWISSPPGALTPDDPNDPDVTGKAVFGFVSRYKKGANVPDGQTEFRFEAAGLTFHSSSYDWLVVAGTRGQFKGMGTVNGVGAYRFILTGIDGNKTGGDGVDRFRIKIWDATTSSLVYDNQAGASDTGTDATTLGGGSIVIHTGKG